MNLDEKYLLRFNKGRVHPNLLKKARLNFLFIFISHLNIWRQLSFNILTLVSSSVPRWNSHLSHQVPQGSRVEWGIFTTSHADPLTLSHLLSGHCFDANCSLNTNIWVSLWIIFILINSSNKLADNLKHSCEEKITIKMLLISPNMNYFKLCKKTK